MENFKEIYRDVLHVSHGPYALLSESRQKSFSWKAPLRAGGHFLKLLKDLLFYRSKLLLGEEDVRHKIWLLVGSKNNRDALAFLDDRLPDAAFVAIHKAAAALGPYTRVSYHFALFYYWRFFPLFFYLYPVFGKMLWQKIDLFAEAVGLYKAALAILKKGKPKALVFSNDHGPHMRVFLWAAKKAGIPTIYLQHASVSEYFPPLRFDLSLLEGRDSLQKYQACGAVEGDIKLIGMPKFDRYASKKNQSKKISRIGLCVSLLDEKKRILSVVRALQIHLPAIALSFRPHPREERSFDLPAKVLISDSKTEEIFDFLQRQDLIIAGDTSTHLEAVLLNIVSVYFPLNDTLSDYYGYVKNGLVPRLETVETLIAYIRKMIAKKTEVYTRAQYYNAVVGTANEGASGTLAVQAIQNLLSK